MSTQRFAMVIINIPRNTHLEPGVSRDSRGERCNDVGLHGADFDIVCFWNIFAAKVEKNEILQVREVQMFLYRKSV